MVPIEVPYLFINTSDRAPTIPQKTSTATFRQPRNGSGGTRPPGCPGCLLVAVDQKTQISKTQNPKPLNPKPQNPKTLNPTPTLGFDAGGLAFEMALGLRVWGVFGGLGFRV